jgi:hypothetical protein
VRLQALLEADKYIVPARFDESYIYYHKGIKPFYSRSHSSVIGRAGEDELTIDEEPRYRMQCIEENNRNR